MESQVHFPKLFDLTDKVAVVTGASGMLGGRISSALASCGADVVVAGRNTEKLKKISEQIGSIKRTALKVKVDVTSESEVENLVSQTLAKFGRVDILVACAGANILKPSKDYRVEDWEKLMQINARGTFLCNREFGKVMIDQKRGKIINISSIRGWFATSANTLGYSASKAAVNMITRVLACEWARFNVNVNAVAPAMVASGMHTATPDGEVLELDPKILEGITKRTPMKRLAKPEDICGTVIFLASEASSFITGQVIYVDGGASAWAA
jgi:NAD(P)-dependent dehydrogenase (short-subunit alcohol dehydrogenase family)